MLGAELHQVGYTADGFVAEADDLSVAGEAMPQVDVAEYWGIRGRDMSEPLSLPNTLADSLDVFFLLPPQDQSHFLRACYWFQQGDHVWRSSMSSAFTSYIQAIETLQPPARSEGHCHCCNRPIGPGPTAHFVDFVERHAPGLQRTGVACTLSGQMFCTATNYSFTMSTEALGVTSHLSRANSGKTRIRRGLSPVFVSWVGLSRGD